MLAMLLGPIFGLLPSIGHTLHNKSERFLIPNVYQPASKIMRWIKLTTTNLRSASSDIFHSVQIRLSCYEIQLTVHILPTVPTVHNIGRQKAFHEHTHTQKKTVNTFPQSTQRHSTIIRGQPCVSYKLRRTSPRLSPRLRHRRAIICNFENFYNTPLWCGMWY